MSHNALEALCQDFEAVGIKILRKSIDGLNGMMIQFPNGNIACIATGEPWHPLSVEHETAEHRKDRLHQWYDDLELDFGRVMDTDTTIG